MFDCGRREEVPQRAVLRNRMVSSPFDPFLIANGFVVFDGGLATELEAQVRRQPPCHIVFQTFEIAPVFMLETAVKNGYDQLYSLRYEPRSFVPYSYL